MHTINLVLGDWSHDGHGITDTVTIKCSHTSEQIKEAYNQAVKNLGFPDLVEDACEEYEDSYLRLAFAQKLVRAVQKQEHVFPQLVIAKMIELIVSCVESDFVADIAEEVSSWGAINLEDIEDLEIYVDSERFAHMYMMIASFGDPTIRWENTENIDINIGGYGLFYS